MAGDRQTPTGTSFDPSPQFSVLEVGEHWPLTVTGRCQFAPVRTGTIFDLLVTPSGNAQTTSPCRLLVEEIRVYERPVDELDQVWSARLVLSGDNPPLLAPQSLLVALASQDAGHWRLTNGLWQRTQG